jgi:diguanylate cyclase (GGDEF)-like protein
MIGGCLADHPTNIRAFLPTRRALVDEITALTLGLLAVFVVVGLPWLSPALLLLVVAADRSTLVRDLQRAASTDVKTGLMTMRAWADQVGRGVGQLRKRRSTGAILMIDLDHFKRINDTYGHLTGDQVLGATAQALSNELRSKDVIGRFGGEEFVVFLDETCYRDAELIADRLRRSVSRLHELNLTPCAVSASIGVALSPRNGYGLPELMRAADAAVFEAKRAGRDTVVMARRPVAGSTGPGSAGVSAADPGPAAVNAAVEHSTPADSLWSAPASLGEPGRQ